MPSFNLGAAGDDQCGSSVCVGLGTRVSACSTAGEWEYLALACLSGHNLAVGSDAMIVKCASRGKTRNVDTQVLSCSAPAVVGEFVQSPDVVGSNLLFVRMLLLIHSCTESSPAQYVAKA